MRVYKYKYKDFFDRNNIKYTQAIYDNGNGKEVVIVVNDEEVKKYDNDTEN